MDKNIYQWGTGGPNLILKTYFQEEGGGKGDGLLVEADAAGLGGGNTLQVVVHQVVAIEEVEDGYARFTIKRLDAELIGQGCIHPVVRDPPVGDTTQAVAGNGKARAVYIVGGEINGVEVQQGCQLKFVSLVLWGIQIGVVGIMFERFFCFAQGVGDPCRVSPKVLLQVKVQSIAAAVAFEGVFNIPGTEVHITGQPVCLFVKR